MPGEAAEAELVDILNPDLVKVRILGINASPRARQQSNSWLLLQEALAGVEEAGGAEVDTFDFGNKKIAYCLHCPRGCNDKLECIFQDDYQAFRQAWLQADGVIWSAPVYHMGPPSQVRAALDRLSEVEFNHHRTSGDRHYPRFCKVGGAIVQGGSRFGGQEVTAQFFMQHFLLMDNLPVTGDMPESYLGVLAQARSKEELLQDQALLASCRSLGRRVTHMARIVKAGMMLLRDALPDEYFYCRQNVGRIDREGSPVIKACL